MSEIVLDTTVLRRADVADIGRRAHAKLMKRRVALLDRIRRREVVVLMSVALVKEYIDQVNPAKNELVKAFLELVTRPDGRHVVMNWADWPGARRGRARECRFPHEDDHVLRTAIRDNRTQLFSEEGRMLNSADCILREFQVEIVEP